ncbi:ABC transporter ATP-binding protein [Oceanibaculum indicum]|uniref:Branched-chain amino acid ABC transporter ATP-binding protein n=2 Tax=Oceanibaculum indicum TaxID=526216 RepID=K2JMD5_9PROT|nr:ABC transporter ATP-binding protein [Oceanibaculum indicum]EKE75562.1 branched-chain amino acid ABC transporter ATP-binding protein [Oceanibaculum indicum P24]RKQ73051.1 branched-chain amino acid transport system ATP-binding protein [Oceanibaculum indicum]
MTTNDILLESRDLVKRFGGLVAVNEVSFTLERNTVLGLIGINGSGKTTVMNCVNGLYKADGGSIRFDGEELIGRSPHEVTRLGIGRTFQVPRVFRRMTLIDNLLVPLLGSGLSDAELTEQAEECLAQVNLHGLRQNYAEELSGGQQKLLELARLIMLDPKLILLDEPFAGVNPSLCQLLLERIEGLLEKGKSFILVSHDLTSIYRLSSHIVVLNEGRKIAEGSVDEVKKNPDVIEAYLGSASA